MFGALLLALGLAAVVGPAAAQAGGGTSPFAEQAAALGLTPAQANALQREVDGYLARTGGTQVAINKIQMTGAELLVPLPGERVARDLAAPATTTASLYGCPYYYFCAYSGTSFTGTVIKAYYCGKYYRILWSGYGSYVNNQTAGVKAAFLDSYYKIFAYSVAAPGYKTSFNWAPVYYIQPC